MMPLRNLRITIRHLLKSPGFTATTVLMLALGIGATTAIFSIVEGVLLRPLPFPHSERLVQLSDILARRDVGGNGEAGVTAPDIQAYTRDTHSFESLGGYQQGGYELSGIGDPAQVNAARLSARSFSSACRSRPSWGRFFTQKEDDQQRARYRSQLLALAEPPAWRPARSRNQDSAGSQALRNHRRDAAQF